MNNRYLYLEKCKGLKLYENLILENSTNPKLHIFRLLSGTADVNDSYKKKKYKFRRNYLSFTYTENNSLINTKNILSPFDNENTLGDLNEIFGNKYKNNTLFSKVEGEIIQCLIANKDCRYKESFVHLYRVIECITYAIPLLYARKSKEYIKTYEWLKNCFNNQSAGELDFFKKFVSVIFSNEDFFKSTIEISIDNVDNEIDDGSKEQLKKLIIKIATVNNKTILKETVNDGDYEFTFTFINFFSFLVNLRNRYFHLHQGGWVENVSYIDTEYPEILFKSIIDKGINWIAIILFEILKIDLEK